MSKNLYFTTKDYAEGAYVSDPTARKADIWAGYTTPRRWGMRARDTITFGSVEVINQLAYTIYALFPKVRVYE